MTHSDTSNTSYGQKKSWESNWQFDSRPQKVENCPNFLSCRWCEMYHWKALNKGYNFASYFISIKGLHTKLWALKVTRVPILGISRLPLGNPRTKWYSGASFVAKHKVYYKGEGGGFPQVRTMVSLLNLWLFVARSCTKAFQLCINQIIV
jgi:hypothetical protein